MKNIYFGTSVHDLYKEGLISVRSFNRFTAAGLKTLQDVQDYEEKKGLLNLRGFGKFCHGQTLALLGAAQDGVPEEFGTTDSDPLNAEKLYKSMSAAKKEYLGIVYNRMRGVLDGRARRFIDNKGGIPYLIPYFGASQEKCREMFPYPTRKKTMIYVFNFNQNLKAEFDRIVSMDEGQVRKVVAGTRYPFLAEEDLHLACGDDTPLFTLLHKYVLASEERSLKVFRCLHGFGKEGKYDRLALAEKMGRTGERIRQISVSAPKDFKKTGFFKQEDWDKYDELWKLPFVTAQSPEYRILADREVFSFGFGVFAHMLTLLKNFRVVETGGVAVAVNLDMMPDFGFSKCVREIKEKKIRCYKKDTWIDLKDYSRNENVVGVLAYLVKEGLHMEVVGGKALIPANRVDVEGELRSILEASGEPISAAKILAAFTERHPGHWLKTTPQVRACLCKTDGISNIGKSGYYGMTSWKDVCYDTIRGIVTQILETADEPVHYGRLIAEVRKACPYSGTSESSLRTSLQKGERFVEFKGGYFGLKEKFYEGLWEVEQGGQRKSFATRAWELSRFVINNNRLPFNSGHGEYETSLYRWMHHSRRRLNDCMEQMEDHFMEAGELTA